MPKLLEVTHWLLKKNAHNLRAIRYDTWIHDPRILNTTLLHEITHGTIIKYALINVRF